MHSKVWGGILLVAGTAIGAGMLALPVATGLSGFIPSLVLFILVWVVMTYTALLLLEVNSWTGAGTNLITMARATIGPVGASLSWTAYLFLLYALLTAYIAGSGAIIGDLLHTSVPGWYYAVPLVTLFAILLRCGMGPFEYFNRILILGLVASYIAMVALLLPHVSVAKLEYTSWSHLLVSAPIVATSFGFHIIIPSLYHYLDGDSRSLQRVLLLGSACPLVVYTIWQALALGIIPLDGPYGLQQGYANGVNGVHLLVPAITNPSLALITQLFSLCAIITSFLGVALSLHDFLADGLPLYSSGAKRWLLLPLTFMPPLLIAAIDPTIFLSALEYAGTFGVVLLLILMPALMVWYGRYHQNRVSTYRVPGGKITLALVIALASTVIAFELINIARQLGPVIVK